MCSVQKSEMLHYTYWMMLTFETLCVLEQFWKMHGFNSIGLKVPHRYHRPPFHTALRNIFFSRPTTLCCGHYNNMSHSLYSAKLPGCPRSTFCLLQPCMPFSLPVVIRCSHPSLLILCPNNVIHCLSCLLATWLFCSYCYFMIWFLYCQ